METAYCSAWHLDFVAYIFANAIDCFKIFGVQRKGNLIPLKFRIRKAYGIATFDGYANTGLDGMAHHISTVKAILIFEKDISIVKDYDFGMKATYASAEEYNVI